MESEEKSEKIMIVLLILGTLLLRTSCTLILQAKLSTILTRVSISRYDDYYVHLFLEAYATD